MKCTVLSIVALMFLAFGAAPASQPLHLRYVLTDAATNAPDDIRKKIVQAIDEAVAMYNANGSFDREIRVNYNKGTPTAEANIDGLITFGGQIGFRTALHELGHCMGVGTHHNWRKLITDGKWTGEHALKQLREFDGPDAVLHADRMHFWPYGLNYDREGGEVNSVRHVKMVIAIMKDLEEAR
jgi:hypothetical protein